MYYPNFLPHHNQPMLLTEAEHQHPQQVIVAFFECYHLVDARRSLKRCLKAAFSHRRLRRKGLLDIIALREALLRLLEAATLLRDEGKAALPEDEPDPLNPLWYLGRNTGEHTHWDYLPRHLSQKQYRNPYRVFHQCARKSTLPLWRGLLEGLVAAASYANMHGEDGCIPYSDKEPCARAQCSRLVQLVEAAHLVYVRERLGEQEQQNVKKCA